MAIGRLERVEAEKFLRQSSGTSRRKDEVEKKIDVSEEEFWRVYKEVKANGAEEIFSGTINIALYDALQKEISLRTKRSVNLLKGDEVVHEFTLKLPPLSDGPTSTGKAKDEFEGEARTAEEALFKLRALASIFGVEPATFEQVILRPTKLRRSLLLPHERKKKDRERGEAPLQMDFDIFTAVNGQLIKPLFDIEIQDTSKFAVAKSAQIKDERIANAAHARGLIINPLVADLSTLGYLRFKGAVEKVIVVRDSALLPQGQSAKYRYRG